MINKRLFGTPIKDPVKSILQIRQGDGVEEVAPGDSVQGEMSEAREPFRMDDKTPFVRMWTSVKIIEPSKLVDLTPAEFENDPDFNFDLQQNDGEYDVDIERFPSWIPADQVSDYGGEEKLQQQYSNQLVVPVKEGKKIIGYSIKKTTDQKDFARKIYEVGNHTYQESYGEVKINESVGSKLTVKEGQGEVEDYSNIFPNELERNKYLKPQAGITSVSSETEGSLGVIKKTTVNFIVHNFKDYDEIYNKYFLKPGATIFVDFGWGNIPYLYRPEELINNVDNIQQFLYGQSEKDGAGVGDGFITGNQGNVEVLQGLVTDYNSKILENGSVECSLTLTSSNNALLGMSLDDKIVSRVKDTLQRGILYLGIRQLITDQSEDGYLYGETDGDDVKQLMETPGKDSSAADIDAYEKNLRLLAIQQLSGKSGPAGNAVRTGIFVDNLTADNVYIAWGLFEDLIINSTFGFGKSHESIDEAKSLEVTLNSSTSFTKWSQLYTERQRVLLRTPEDPPVFLFPDWWGNSDPKGVSSSYSYQKDKYPLFDYNDKGLSFDVDKTMYDKQINGTTQPGRIPLREVFVNVETIIEAFEAENTIKKALEKILEELNDDSDGFFRWAIQSGEIDSQLRIIDKQYTLNDEEEEQILADNPLFQFKVMSPKSIVKDYDLSFKLPSGNIGNMYAIQGMSHGNSLFTTNGDVLDTVAINATDPDALSIIYEPDLGSLRADELLDDKNSGAEEDVYDMMNQVFDTNTFNVTADIQPDLIPGDESEPLTTEGIVEDSGIVEVQESETESDDLVQKNDRILELKGYKVATSFRDYYKIKIIKEVVSKNKPVLLPYELSLTTYGISSIIPGDTFTVDYLPKMYLDTTYLQTTKVIHDVGPGGWYTTLNTQFRLKPKEINNISNVDRARVRISPTVFNKQNFADESIEVQDGWFDNSEIGIKSITPFMTDCKIVNIGGTTEGKLDYVIDFQCTKKLTDILSDGGGVISHIDSPLYAYYGSEAADSLLALKKHGMGMYVAPTWVDYVLPTSLFYKTLGNFLFSGTDAKYQHLYYHAVPSGFYIYPPYVQLEPGHRFYMIVRGDGFAFLPHKNNPYGYKGYDMVKFFDDFVGDNRDGWLN